MSIANHGLVHACWAGLFLVGVLACDGSQHGQVPAKPEVVEDSGHPPPDSHGVAPDATGADSAGPSDVGGEVADTPGGVDDAGPVDTAPDTVDTVDSWLPDTSDATVSPAADVTIEPEDTEVSPDTEVPPDTTPEDAGVGPDDVDLVDADTQQDVAEPPVPGDPCDDQNACTTDDTWTVDGLCVGTLATCADADPCTQDHCYVRVGCTHVADPACGDPACRECPSGLGFACDTSVTPAICRNATTREVYVPSGLFRYGEYEKANALPGWGGPWPALEQSYQSPQSMYLPGFIIDEVEVDAFEYAEAGLSLCLPPPPPGVVTCDETPGKPVPVVDSYNFVGWYCNSVGKRACLESEWEKTAVGGCAQLGVSESDTLACREATRVFVWGDAAPTCSLAYELFTCGAEMVLSASHPADRSVYGAYDMGGTFEEATMPIAPADQTCPLAAQVGSDGVLPPITTVDYSYQCPSDPHFNWGLSMLLRGNPWIPAARREPFYDYIGGVDYASFRCCRSVDAAAVGDPWGEPLWPPDLESP